MSYESLRSRANQPNGIRERGPDHVRRMSAAIQSLKNLMILYNIEERDYSTLEHLKYLTEKYEDEVMMFKCFFPYHELGLRYDLTTQYALYDKRVQSRTFQVGKVYRGETGSQTQNRWKEFYQFDVDLRGFDRVLSLSEIFDIMSRGFQTLGIRDVVVKVNSRRELEEVATALGVPKNKFCKFCTILDKLDKIGWEEVEKQWEENKLEQVDKLRTGIEAWKCSDELEKLIQTLGRYSNLTVQWCPTLVRGLAYYTDIIWEVVDHTDLTIAGGGEYEDRIGFSFGLDRMLLSMQLNQPVTQPYTIIALGDEGCEVALKVAKELRDQDLPAEIFRIDSIKQIRRLFGKIKEKYSTPCATFGPDEIATYKSYGTIIWK